MSAYKATFTLPYQKGTLRAEGVRNGTIAETITLQTAGEARTIRLTADHTSLKADGQDLAYITVELLDANGIPNPIASQSLTAQVKGQATLLAFGNADIKDLDRYTDAEHKTWKGRALLVVKSKRKAGSAEVTVSGGGLTAGKVKLVVK